MELTINEFSPVYGIDGNIMLMKSGSIAIAYRLELPEIYTGHDDYYIDIVQNLGKNLFTLLPEDTVIQFQYTYKLQKSKNDFLKEDTFIQKCTKKHFNKRNFLEQDLTVYFILPNAASYKSGYASFIVKSIHKDVSYKINKIEEFYEKVKRATDTLSNNYDYFSFIPVEENKLEKKLKGFLNFNSTSYSDLIKTGNHLTYGNKQIEIFSLAEYENLPDSDMKPFKIDHSRSTDMTRFYRPLMSELGLEFFCDHLVNLVVFYDSQKYWKSQLDNQIKKLNGARTMSAKNLKNAQINIDFLNDIEDTNRSIVRFHFSVLLFADNPEELKKQTDYVEGAFNKLRMKPYNVKADSIPYLSGMFPGNADRIPKQETIITYDEFPFLFFIPEGNYRIDKEGFVFNDRLSQLPVSVDTFTKPYETKLIDNRNFLVIAPSGGGKSFLMKHILRQFVEENLTKTVVINIGGDDKLVKTYREDSAYIMYKDGEPLNVNPFYIEENMLSKDKIEFLIDFIEILWKNGQLLSNDERSTIENVILEYYRATPADKTGFDIDIDKSKMNVKGFFAFLEDHFTTKKNAYGLINTESLMLNLKKYATGSFSNLFTNGKPAITESKKYVEFELDNIKDHKILFPIFGMLISDLTFNTMWKSDGSKKMFFIDEAWKILEKPGMASLLKYLYKTIRKFTGGVGIAVQQITDIPEDETGRAILGNSAVKYLLNHSNVMSDIPALKERLSLSERMVSMLLSVRNNKKGKFPHTEFLLILGTYAKVLRLEVPPEVLEIYESDKNQTHLFNDLYEKYRSVEETVKSLIKMKTLN